MSPNKTQPVDDSVTEFIDRIDNVRRRRDAGELLKLMRQITGLEPVMWGSSIVGFGSYHYIYESGREGDTPIVSFAPRKDALVVYGVLHHEETAGLIEHLGPHTTGKGCLYLKDLSTVDLSVLGRMIERASTEKSVG